MAKKRSKNEAAGRPQVAKVAVNKFQAKHIGKAQLKNQQKNQRTQKIASLRARLGRLMMAKFPPSWASKPSQRQLCEACRDSFGPHVMSPGQYGFSSATALNKWLYEQACAYSAAGGNSADELEAADAAADAAAEPERRSPGPKGSDVQDLLAALGWTGPAVSLQPSAASHSRLHVQLVQLASVATLSGRALERRRGALARVSKLIHEAYPAATLEIFGSSSTGLTIPSSDIDLVMSLPEATSAKKPLRKLESTFRHVSAKLELIIGAKIPLLKFVEKESGLSFDLCANATSGVENSAFIRRHLERYPALRPLVLALKVVLQQAGLHDTFTGGIGSYLLFLMVLKVVERIWERGIETSFGVGTRDPIGDLGLQLRAVLRSYSQGSSTLEIIDPLSDGQRTAGQKDIGAKAFRFGEVARLFRTLDARLAGDADCLSAVLRGWPAEGPAEDRGLRDYGALMHLCQSTFREPPQGRNLANGGGANMADRWDRAAGKAPKRGKLGKQQKWSSTIGGGGGGGGRGSGGASWASKGHGRKGGGDGGGRKARGSWKGELSSAIGKPGRKAKGGKARGKGGGNIRF